ncbi:MAG: GDP-L-fucose synthase [Desulfovibrio sp.]|jgi:GDP-L-fucose synthase|nr:GDP-L-fucose synthase [Desulfovibrio sp.]
MNELLRRRIYVAGHRGMVGSAICRKLRALGASGIITRTHAELDLCSQADTEAFFREQRPDYVILAAARVGGIVANDSYSADFTRENLQIQTNVIDSAYRNGCLKLLFLGSSCIYPKFCPQPMKEEYLLSGPLEPTNDGYAVAKIAGLMLCKAYRKQYGFDAISVMPGNLYGSGDNFHPENSHVVPALLRRFHEAKCSGAGEVTIWGTGKPMREFLHVDDAADAALFLLRNYSGAGHVNVGSGFEMSTLELAKTIAEVVGFSGAIRTDPSKPDGTPRKLMDSSFLYGMGWRPAIDFCDGLRATYRWYLEHEKTGGVRKD